MASARKVKAFLAIVRLKAKAQCRSDLRMSTRPDAEPTHARYTLSSVALGEPYKGVRSEAGQMRAAVACS